MCTTDTSKMQVLGDVKLTKGLILPGLPLLEWFVLDPEAARWDEETPSSLIFRGKYYDNVQTRRKGSGRGTDDTDQLKPKDWPKRKFKFGEPPPL